uniref:Phosphomannomutase n=1 Tax=Curvibacter symbiont subsp. Hydra magnipapillata TaxID=667019 RepID=C9Y8A5_CURXX|nr:Phosphomannomutase [Curvibacter putative symbiont of Hydra magnipapillata]
MTVLTLQDMATQSGVAFGTSGARGKVADMTPDLCHAYTTAFLNAVVPKATTIVLGHDLRPSSPEIAAACAAAIESLGMTVVYGGALPTPALALYAAQTGSPAIVVTGSHIPFDRNGIKFYKEDGEITKADERAMLDFLVGLPKQLKLPKLPAPDARVEQAYLDRYIRFFGANALLGETIAVYEHSSVARDVLRTILESLGAEVISLGRTDVFVPIDTEAVRHEDIEQAREWAELYDFDAIVSTDGDADRPLIGDEKGEWMRGDVVGILTAQYLHATAVVTPVSSNSALERTQSFAQVVRTRIGSPYVIEGMQQAAHDGAELVVGYEANGGFLLGSQVLRKGQRLGPLPTRDAVLPMLALLCGAKAQALKMSEVGYRLPKRFTASDRIQNFATASSRELIASLRNDHVLLRNVMAPQAGPVEAIDETDGLRVHFASGDIVHLRPSGNAPELRCYAESTSVRSAKRLCDECLLRILKTAAPA